MRASIFPAATAPASFSKQNPIGNGQVPRSGRPEPLETQAGSFELLERTGKSVAMQSVLSTIAKFGPTPIAMLVRGETGTGKELVARALHNRSPRAAGPFLAINCAAIPETLLESDLFGHEKGAYTDAGKQRIGKFEQCSGGTLFLDEIGDMPPLMQSKMLRVIQEQRFERLGGNETLQTDVRLIAATNRNLEELIQQGQFRQDFCFRLNGETIGLPRLRDRGEDILPLAAHFAERFAEKYHKLPCLISEDALKLFREYPWQGNVRELEHAVERAVILAQPDCKEAHLLTRDLFKLEGPVKPHLEAPAQDLTALVLKDLQMGQPPLLGFRNGDEELGPSAKSVIASFMEALRRWLQEKQIGLPSATDARKLLGLHPQAPGNERILFADLRKQVGMLVQELGEQHNRVEK